MSATDRGDGTTDTKASALTLARGIQVLELLANDERELNVAEIATRLGLHRPTVYRLLNTLIDRSLVHRVGSNRYGLGLGLLELSRHVNGRMQRVVHPYLRHLSERLKVTAHCVVAENEEAVTLCLAEPDEGIFVRSERVGSRRPLTPGATGLAILSAREPRRDDGPEITKARELGYVITRGQVTPDAVGVAAALVDADGRSLEAAIGAISMRDDDVQLLVDEVRAAARAISAELAAP